MLQLTYKELESILMGNFLPERFEITYNNIPAPTVGQTDYDISDYLEDDGRRITNCEFIDHSTNTEYFFCYVDHPEHTTELRYALMDKIENIEIVDISVINPPQVKTEVKKVDVVETDEEKRIRLMNEEYDSIDKVDFDAQTSKVPLAIVDDLITFVSQKNFSKRNLLDKFTPICIQYKTERNTLWRYIASKA